MIAIKGTREGLVLTLGQGEMADLLPQLERELEDKAAFLAGGQVALRIGSREPSDAQLGQIEALLGRYQIGLRVIKEGTPDGDVGVPGPDPGSARGEQEARQGSSGLLIRGTLRSGQLITHSGHVVVMGDVNPGAEVIAGGDIVVWGKLRGTVHAGAGGDEKAVACALQLTPIQVRIAGYIARSPDREDDAPLGPEMARIQNDRIVAEPWVGTRGH